MLGGQKCLRYVDKSLLVPFKLSNKKERSCPIGPNIGFLFLHLATSFELWSRPAALQNRLIESVLYMYDQT